MKNKSIYIGIDPGVDTGICIWDADKKVIVDLITLNFWSVIDLVLYYQKLKDTVLTVVVEDPNLNKAIHWNQKKSVGGLNAATKIAQNVGMNKKEASLILQYLKINDFQYKAIKPTARKVTASYFKQLTGYEKRTNQHCRDAAMLVIRY